jgi:hypothetical protein
VASITMTMEEYNLLNGQADQWKEQTRKLEKELHEARLVDPSNRLNDYATALQEALAIVQFAVANLDPKTVRRWPYQSLRIVADLVPRLEAVKVHTREATEDWKIFANQCDELEELRRQGRQHEVLTRPQ